MKKILYTFYLMVLLFGTSCKKYLDEKPDKKLAVITSAKDLQALLDNSNMMTATYPVRGEVAADNYYMLQSVWQNRNVTDQNAYIWERDMFNDSHRNDWSSTYVVVNYANVVLDNLSRVDQSNTALLSNIKGQALFFRSFAFYNLLQLFAKPYDLATAERDLGIALRLSSDLNIPTTRASVKRSYGQLIADTKEAIQLLPVTPLVKTRPSKPAAYALLARTYLSMADYNNAYNYADSALQLYNTLINYNCTCINPNAANPFIRFNDEVIFHAQLFGSGTLTLATARIDSTLYQSYHLNDIRRTAFFQTNSNGSIGFKGSYVGSSAIFGGLATDEIYFIRAESAVRIGKLAQGLSDYNTIMVNRFKTNTYIAFNTTDTQQALRQILAERRKQLLYRGLRWSDLRRLNKEPQFAITLKRILGADEYTLPPNSFAYVMPIPLNVIQLTGIQQN